MFYLGNTPTELLLLAPQEALLCSGLLILLILSTQEWFTGHLFTICAAILVSYCIAMHPFLGVGYHHLLVCSSSVLMCKTLLCVFFLLVLAVDYFFCGSGKGTLVLLLFALLFMLLLSAANDWFFLFLSLEALSLSLYALIGMPRTRLALEAVTLYFAFGALSTCFLLFGILIVFLANDSVSFSELRLGAVPIFFSSFFLSCSILLKVGSAPFHFWVIDAYEGAPSIVTLLMATCVKLCLFILLCRLLYGPLLGGFDVWLPLVQLCSGFSIVVGCTGALFQKSLKRMLAYSSVNNLGYALAGLSSGNIAGLHASVTYMLFYCAVFCVLFAIIVGFCPGKPLSSVSDFARLKSCPYSSIAASLLLFSLAGIPPLTGFWTKFFILHSLVGTGLYTLAALGAFASIVSSFYYVSLIKVIYFEDGKPETYHSSMGLPFFAASVFIIFLYPLAPSLVNFFTMKFALGLLVEFF